MSELSGAVRNPVDLSFIERHAMAGFYLSYP